MLSRPFHMSSTWESFKSEWDHLTVMFTNLKYPDSLIKSTICHFVTSVRSENPAGSASSVHQRKYCSPNSFAFQRSKVSERSEDSSLTQLSDLNNKIDHTLQPAFKSRKICEDLKMCEPKPLIISQQCVVYNYKCDLCDAEYVGYTSRHSHQRIDEHRYSAIGKHLKIDHGPETIGDLTNNFPFYRNATENWSALFIKKKSQCLTTQSDSTRAKLFI